MHRRDFMALGGTALLGAAFGGCSSAGAERTNALVPRIDWSRHARSRLCERVSVEGRALVDPAERVGPLDGFCALIQDGKAGEEASFGGEMASGTHGPLRVTLAHELRRSSGGEAEDLLEAVLTLSNTSDRPCEALAGFLCGARPCANPADQQVYLPLGAAGLGDKEDDPRGRLKDCRQAVGAGGLLCHYLEPQSCDPRHTSTRAALLVPVVDIFADGGPCRAALFGTSTEPMCFEALQGPSARAWRAARRVQLAPGESQVVKAFLLLHAGDAATAWDAFRRFGHREDFPAIAWPRDVRVHYFDFFSPAELNGPRGRGYDVDLAHFAEFHVGMATQHGYYLSYGDFIHPDRKEWRAMAGDPAGPVTTSIEKLKARVEATRKAGVRPAIYMHYTILDEGSPLFEGMRDSILVDAKGAPTVFGWEGPDVIKKTWRMSPNSPQWRAHLVQQARWIMELLDPDAIVLDETFTAWGWDHHKTHGGPLSRGGIELMRALRATVRAFGPEKALFASDCSMANFCLWGDGEGGDHCYDRLLGHELYRKSPVRYTAALGSKAWLPCAWLCASLWPAQVDLARTTGAAVGVTNGWGDGFGLARLPAETKAQMLRDIASLVKA